MRRIMIIDDDAVLLQTLEIFLKNHYDVVTFQEVEPAISYLDSYKVDIIILDIRMPEISGIMAFDMIKQSENGNQIPIIFLSGLSDKRTVVECIEMGAMNYLLKPVKMELLIEVIESTLGTVGVPVVTSEKPLLLMITKQQDIKNFSKELQEKYCVVMASNVIPALEFVKKNKPRVLLVDYDLPVYNGVQTVAKIREAALEPNFGTVIAYRDLDEEKKVEMFEVNGFGLKIPFTGQELFARLEEAQELVM